MNRLTEIDQSGAILPSSTVDRQEVSTQDRIMEMMEKLMRRQDQRVHELEDRLARAGAQKDGDSNSGME